MVRPAFEQVCINHIPFGIAQTLQPVQPSHAALTSVLVAGNESDQPGPRSRADVCTPEVRNCISERLEGLRFSRQRWAGSCCLAVPRRCRRATATIDAPGASTRPKRNSKRKSAATVNTAARQKSAGASSKMRAGAAAVIAIAMTGETAIAASLRVSPRARKPAGSRTRAIGAMKYAVLVIAGPPSGHE